ncbi:hypothetical protein PG993_004413 [Apiospora rasikravindrae]|uniref:Heterokaryon incompatibility domain-containing protein n=1 Tax=Apiospora rasikravindrae TaxID=990691 RepID=A0ABR1TF38_9PEZI
MHFNVSVTKAEATEFFTDSSVTEALHKWRGDFKEANRKTQIPYRFSPEYEVAWDAAWKSYDELEARRVALQIPILEWQEDVVRRREQMAWYRREFFIPMQEPYWHICPLWVHLDRTLGSANADREYTWKATLDNWHAFRCAYLEDRAYSRGQRGLTFKKSLSGSQMLSFEILNDWWSSSYAHEYLAKSARTFMKSGIDSVALDPVRLAQQQGPEKGMSLYHSLCFELFLHELNPQRWEPNMSHNTLHYLQSKRYLVSRNAIAQSLALSILKIGKGPTNSSYPRINLNNRGWDQDIKPPGGLPRYLWDTRERKTVLVSGLGFRPDYTCISHTWGRWRRPSLASVKGVDWLVPENGKYDVRDLPSELAHLSARYVWLDLFCIPQDDRKESGVGRRGRKLLVRDIEIERQSGIFRCSSTCVAWLHDVQTWTGVRRGLEWIAMKYLSATNTQEEVMEATSTEKMSMAWAEADVPAELTYLPALENGEVYNAEQTRSRARPVTWFSSLWTLQEALLCPGIELYSRNWTRLEDNRGCAISLSTLTNFLDLTRQLLHTEGILSTVSIATPGEYYQALLSARAECGQSDLYDLPMAVSNLRFLMDLTGLSNILSGRSISRVFVGASTRECTSDRAPAIMSAIGITEWYLERPPARLTNLWMRREPLVLGVYPLRFLRAAFEKDGSQFMDGAWFERKRLTNRDLLLRRPTGSMLPFSRAGFTPRDKKFNMPENPSIEVTGHPSVASWKIRADGSIRIRSAGLWATSGTGSVRSSLKYEGFVHWHDLAQNIDRVERVEDLVTYLSKMEIGGSLYAVALYKDGSRHCGVLLQTPPRRISRCRYLLNVGRFSVITSDEMPPTSLVNWVVL